MKEFPLNNQVRKTDTLEMIKLTVTYLEIEKAESLQKFYCSNIKYEENFVTATVINTGFDLKEKVYKFPISRVTEIEENRVIYIIKTFCQARISSETRNKRSVSSITSELSENVLILDFHGEEVNLYYSDVCLSDGSNFTSFLKYESNLVDTDKDRKQKVLKDILNYRNNIDVNVIKYSKIYYNDEIIKTIY